MAEIDLGGRLEVLTAAAGAGERGPAHTKAGCPAAPKDGTATTVSCCGGRGTNPEGIGERGGATVADVADIGFEKVGASPTSAPTLEFFALLAVMELPLVAMPAMDGKESAGNLNPLERSFSKPGCTPSFCISSASLACASWCCCCMPICCTMNSSCTFLCWNSSVRRVACCSSSARLPCATCCSLMSCSLYSWLRSSSTCFTCWSIEML
mmetsp:Transcript_86273/g.244532  ORF Transcript_86273/g.244532 Transcript_86273/m.244532 type:complete len:210 (-) Transcript_86273:410-1039(-)